MRTQPEGARGGDGGTGLCEEDVLGLEIAMDDPRRVDDVQRGRELDQPDEELPVGEVAPLGGAPLDLPSEVAPTGVLGDDAEELCLLEAAAVPDDVRMRQRR